MVAFCQGLVLFAGQLLFSASYPVRVHIGFVLYCKGVKQYMISTAAALTLFLKPKHALQLRCCCGAMQHWRRG